MKNFALVSFASALLLISCQTDSGQSTPKAEAVQPVVKVVQTDGTPKILATLAIEGMGCEMACGGSIKKALSGMDGVVATEIRFDADNETDFAVVEYDESKVSGEQMIAVVNELRKGHYNVSALTIEKHVASAGNGGDNASQESAASEKAQGKPQMETRSFNFPNILDILNRFIR
jgi:copper chaperone CopZ